MHRTLESRRLSAGLLAGLGKFTWRTSNKEFLSPKRDLQAIVNKRSELREALLEVCDVDFHKAMKICQGRRVTFEATENSFFFFDRVDDPWPSKLFVSFFFFFEDGAIFLLLWLNFNDLHALPLCGSNSRFSVPVFVLHKIAQAARQAIRSKKRLLRRHCLQQHVARCWKTRHRLHQKRSLSLVADVVSTSAPGHRSERAVKARGGAQSAPYWRGT